MLSGCAGEFDGDQHDSDSISGNEFSLSGGADEYASDDYDDGCTSSAPVPEVEEEEARRFSPKEGSGELGHLRRSHPNRGGYGGATPPSLQDTDDAALPPSSSSSGQQRSGRDPRLTPFEILCSCIMLTLRCRDGRCQVPEQQPPQSPSVNQGQLGAVDERSQTGIVGPSVTSDEAAAHDDKPDEDPGPENVSALLCCVESVVKIPRKRRRSVSKEDDGDQANKKPKLAATAPTEKRAYVCKHCKAEFFSYQALGGHMAGHHRDKKIPAALNTDETSPPDQVVATGQSRRRQRAEEGDEESRRSSVSQLNRRLQVEIPMASSSNMDWLPRQAPGGHVKLQCVRRNDGTPPVVTSAAADGDRCRQLNFDLNVELPEQD